MHLKRGFVLGLVCGIVLCSGVAYADSITKQISVNFGTVKKIVIDGVDKTPVDKKPFTYDGTTYVPLRYISESLGKSVQWDGSTGTVSIGYGNTTTSVPYLTDIKPYSITQPAYSSVLPNVTTKDMFIGNVKYTRGIQITSNSIKGTPKIFYNLDGKYTRLTATVGMDDGANLLSTQQGYSGKATLDFYGDDALLGSVSFKNGDLSKYVDINLRNCKRFAIVATYDNYYDVSINIIDPIINQ